MFSFLTSKELKVVIEAMEQENFKAGAYIITQGEKGEKLYVVE